MGNDRYKNEDQNLNPLKSGTKTRTTPSSPDDAARPFTDSDRVDLSPELNPVLTQAMQAFQQLLEEHPPEFGKEMMGPPPPGANKMPPDRAGLFAMGRARAMVENPASVMRGSEDPAFATFLAAVRSLHDTFREAMQNSSKNKPTGAYQAPIVSS